MNTCRSCKWFWDGKAYYECRKRAPRAYGTNNCRPFPKVSPSDFCGEWTPSECADKKLEPDFSLFNKVPPQFFIWANEINAWFREPIGRCLRALGPIQSRFVDS